MPIYLDYTTQDCCMFGLGKVQNIKQFLLNVYSMVITPRNVSSAILPSSFRQGCQNIPLCITKEFQSPSFFYFDYRPTNSVLPMLQIDFLAYPQSQVQTPESIRLANLKGTNKGMNMSRYKTLDRTRLRHFCRITLTSVKPEITLLGDTYNVATQQWDIAGMRSSSEYLELLYQTAVVSWNSAGFSFSDDWTA
jgi:hypothetical protein